MELEVFSMSFECGFGHLHLFQRGVVVIGTEDSEHWTRDFGRVIDWRDGVCSIQLFGRDDNAAAPAVDCRVDGEFGGGEIGLTATGTAPDDRDASVAVGLRAEIG